MSFVCWTAAGWSPVRSADPEPDSPVDEPAKRALLIGVDDYAFLANLRYCGRDMQALRARLIVTGFREEHVTLLHDATDHSRLRPFKRNIERELEALFQAAGPEDLVLIAFSGHGVHLEGISYICPIEARLERPGSSMISLEGVYRQLEASRARQKLLIVDSCRNDPQEGGIRGIEESTETLDGFSRTLETPPQGTLLLASCQPGEVSFEDDQYRHGVFMNFLLQGLDGEADRALDGNADGQVSLLELYNFASLRTRTHVARTRNRVQTPVLYGNLSGDFPLAATLPRRPDELPSRFYRRTHQGIDNILFSDPQAMTAREPRVLLALRNAHQLLLPEYTYGFSPEISRADCEQALSAINEAIRQEPTNAFAYLLRAIAYRKQGEYAAAWTDYDRLNLPMELSVAPGIGSDGAALRIDDRVVGRVEGLERLVVTKIEGDLVWVDEVRPAMGRAAVEDDRRGWLSTQALHPELEEQAAGADRYTSRSDMERLLTNRTIGRERIAAVDAEAPAALDALEQAYDLLGERRGGGLVYLRSNLPPDELQLALRFCHEALEIEPENRSGLLLRALIYREQKDYAAALADCQQADQSLRLVLRRRAVELKTPRGTTGNARLGDTLTISQIKDDWLWIAAVNGDSDQQGWLTRQALEQEEAYTTRALRPSRGTSRSPIPPNIRGEALRRARGFIPYSGWLPF